MRRLNAWNNHWQSGGSLEQPDAWLSEGAELARLLQLQAEQAGENVQVVYWHDKSRNPRYGSLNPRHGEG